MRSEPIRFANLSGSSVEDGNTAVSLAAQVNSQFDPSLSWADVEWMRSVWDGPIVIKGIQTVADAVLAADAGVDAIALSNHGGRQLDTAPATLDLVAPCVDAVGRSHRDHLRRRCAAGERHREGRGARRPGACMAGRAYLYGLGAAGERGVDHVLHLLETDMRRVMALLGASRLSDLNRELVD